MAAAPLYNKPLTCLCDKPAEYHCNTCGDTLCSNCKVIHQKSKGTRDHSIVPYGEKLRPEHLSSLSCPDHKGKDCTFWCEKCSKATCMDCVTSTHSAHKMIKLETVLKEKTAMLKKELANLESKKLKGWKDLSAEAKQVTADYLEQINGVEKELDERAKEFHAKVDEIFKASKRQLQDLKKSNLTALHQQEKMVSDGLEKVKQEIKECEDKLRKGSMESLLKYKEKQEEKKVSLPKISPMMPPIFTQGQIDSQSLVEMFGRLTNQVGKQRAENPTKPEDLQRSAEKGKAAPLQGASGSNRKSEKSIHPGNQKSPQQITVPTLTQRQLMSTPSVQSSFHTGFWSDKKSIACVGSGVALVKTGDFRIQLIDQRGDVMDTIDTAFDFNDVVLSPKGELLLSDTNKRIKSISPDKEVRTLIRTQWIPNGLCCLHSGGIAVTFYDEGRVIIYSMSGKTVEELGANLFLRPYRVAQSKVNDNLYICDIGSRDILDTHGKIVALDASYHLRYEYKGRGNAQFKPNDLCTESAGRVLITDYYNHSVHILDNDGRFLQYLLTMEQGLRDPVSIDVDSKGNAWVGEEYGEVKVMKYLQ